MRRNFLVFVCTLFSLSLFAADKSPAKDLHAIYRDQLSSRMVPLLTEVIAFPTFQGNVHAREQQQAWLRRVGTELGFTVRDAGLITEIELPGPAGAPVLGLMVHGDVQPVSETEWSSPPFTATQRNGWIYGRGTADDKGPLIQALLAMKALQISGVSRTHTIRLLVGSDEESDNLDVKTYLESHSAPDYTLVLDCLFPVVVGEKAWVEFTQSVADPYRIRGDSNAPLAITKLEAGLATSIVPSLAQATLRWLPESDTELPAAVAHLKQTKTSDGISYEVTQSGREAQITVHGRAAHSGMNLTGGRNALVFLANMLHQQLAPNGAADLLEFAHKAGADLHGQSLGVAQSDPIWGNEDVNVATIKPDGDRLKEAINLRHFPPMSIGELRVRLEKQVAEFNVERGAALVPGGYYLDHPTVFKLDAKLVKRLMADYERATGERNTKPAVSGGGTYAKRLPNSIAFGMWLNDKPYSAHASNEGIPLVDLHRGVDILLVALLDLATGPRIEKPLEP